MLNYYQNIISFGEVGVKTTALVNRWGDDPRAYEAFDEAELRLTGGHGSSTVGEFAFDEWTDTAGAVLHLTWLPTLQLLVLRVGP